MVKEYNIEEDDLRDWGAALDVLVEEQGLPYGQELLQTLAQRIGASFAATHYWNTAAEHYDVDVQMVEKVSCLVRWNAAQMVCYAGTFGSEIGGHLSSYASSSILYEIGFNYFFKGQERDMGDLVLYQGHSSPGMYARSYLESQLTLEQVMHFRREVDQKGVSSYPHPWLMPNYWQFPTVSMGLGPLQGIYHARLMKYLTARGLIEKSDRKVWVFCGDGEMDEVESIGALGVATREKVDNLIFVVNCNLVRLDGPCRGNTQIIPELARYFSGAGWEVLQLVWSQSWLDLAQQDSTNYLKRKMQSLVDGELQVLLSDIIALQKWFEDDAKLSGLVRGWSKDDFKKLQPGGHDTQLVADAYARAVSISKPVVILALTAKGRGLEGVVSQNNSHNQKKLSDEQKDLYLDYLNLKEEVERHDFYHPGEKDARIEFMHDRRKALGGYIPTRQAVSEKLEIPGLDHFETMLNADEDREFSTTMAYVRFLNLLLRDKNIAERVVPILCDEGRTLGMEGMFRQVGIYQPDGQKYVPVDKQGVSFYKEDSKGQLLQEGINEAGAMSSWIAAATSYSVHHCPLIPIYSFYSMFGFQRVGDLIWAAADSRARGFLMGATAGKTTLGGEGLQHNDGHSHLIASTVPNCRSYDPCYAYELAVIMQHGLHEMYHEQKDVFYYITMMNENYTHPQMPEGVESDIVRGMYCIEDAQDSLVDLMASGAILRQALLAAKWLRENLNISVRVWSVTSWTELSRESYQARIEQKRSFLEGCLGDCPQVVVAASDYVRALPAMLHEAIGRPYYTLGTDGFGMSDTRDALRGYYGVCDQSIAVSVMRAMVDVGLLDASELGKHDLKAQNKAVFCDDRRQM